jgi:hypothetical protein
MGVLLYSPEEQFLQVLEDEEAIVQDLYYEHIRFDPRHCDTMVFSKGS